MVVLEGQRLRVAVVHGLLVADVVDQRDDMRIVHRGHCATKFSDGHAPKVLPWHRHRAVCHRCGWLTKWVGLFVVGILDRVADGVLDFLERGTSP